METRSFIESGLNSRCGQTNVWQEHPKLQLSHRRGPGAHSLNSTCYWKVLEMVLDSVLEVDSGAAF